MRGYIRSLWVSVVCAVVLSGAPRVAVADQVNPSSGSSETTTSLMAMITPTSMTSKVSSYGNAQLGAVPATRAVACNFADQYTQCISLSPSHGPAGAQVKVNGTGWHDHAIRGLDVLINIEMTEVARAHPSADGTFSVAITIPTSTPAGALEVDAIIGNGGSATARYIVTGGGLPAGQQQTQPSVAFSPPEGPPGTATTAHGHGFVPNQSVKVTQAGGPGVTGGGGTVQADQSGSIKMGFRIADKTPEGVITATFAQGTSTTTAQFQVTPLSSTPATGQPSGGELAQVAQATALAWKIIDSLNTVCSIDQCRYVPPDISQVISKISKADTIRSLADAIRLSVVVGNDLSALNNAIKGHVKGTSYSAKVLALRKKTGNDTRALHEALVSVVPGLSSVFPVPPPF